jgi:hypothetical protein
VFYWLDGCKCKTNNKRSNFHFFIVLGTKKLLYCRSRDVRVYISNRLAMLGGPSHCPSGACCLDPIIVPSLDIRSG